MGHQINFFVTQKDVAVLESALRATVPLVILHSRSDNERPRVVESLDHHEGEQPWLYFYLVRPQDLAQIATDYVPAQSYWGIDTTTSPVVEFHRSFFNGKVLRRGRVYYVDSFYGSDQALVSKSEEFKRWAKQILSVVRKNLVKHGANYIGPDAKALLSSDGTTTALEE